MRRNSISTTSSLAIALGTIGFFATVTRGEESKSVTFEESIAAVLRMNCVQCHGEAKQEAGLNFASFSGVMKGGSGGAVVVAGRSSASRLVEVITAEDPAERMPPDNDPLAAADIAMIKTWIDTGLRENAGSSAAQMRTLGFKPAAAQQAGDAPPPVPEAGKLPAFERRKTIRPYPVLALAASPRAPLAAKASYGAIDLMASPDKSYGAIAFPEGEPLVLKFSPSGRVLLAAGGKPVQNGSAVLFDVTSGKRLASVGEEPDAVMAADLSPDERLVAIGGSGKVVKIFSTEDGKLLHTLVKHTDWVTAVAFSPNGKLLATGDRTGNIHLWDAASGGVVLPFSEHKKSVRGLSWRSDSGVVASCGDDGTIVWWDVKDGWPVVNKANAHGGGVLDVQFGPTGELASCGRDGQVKLWAADGNQLKSFSIADSPAAGGAQPAATPVPPGVKLLPTRVTLSADGSLLLAGDSVGRLHAWPTK